MLSKNDLAILTTLREDSGLLTRRVSEKAPIDYLDNKRMRSGAVRSWLVNLKKLGLVDFLDNEKPVCWKRTAAGTAALQQTPGA